MRAQEFITKGSEQKPVTIYTNPANQGATVDDSIKKSLPVIQVPFDKLQQWESHKTMQDPRVADWVNTNLLPQLQQNGTLDPLSVWDHDGELFVIDGNHRFVAYQEAGYNGRVPVQIVPDEMITIVDTVMNEQGVAEDLNFDEIYGKYLKVTDNSGDPGEPGFSLVTPLNGESWNWRERPEFKDLVKQKLNDPGFLGDHKYQQIIDAMSGKQFDPTKHIAKENFADGKNPGRKGLSKRMGVNTKASVSSLRKTAKNSTGEKQRMAHWLANMKSGRAKNK